jgi:hypothetical protein
MQEAFLVGGYIGVALWGALTVLFFATLNRMYGRACANRNAVITTTVVIMYVLTTALMVLSVARSVTAFVWNSQPIALGGAVVPGPVAYLSNTASGLEMASDAATVTLVS